MFACRPLWGTVVARGSPGVQPSFEAGVVLYEMAMNGAMPLARYPDSSFQGRPEFGTIRLVNSPARHTLQAIIGVVRFRSTLWFFCQLASSFLGTS